MSASQAAELYEWDDRGQHVTVALAADGIAFSVGSYEGIDAYATGCATLTFEEARSLCVRLAEALEHRP